MQPYANFAPTCFDPKGAFLPDRTEWLVAPVSVTRDTTDPITRSNWEQFQAALEEIDPLGNDWEVHSFGHWGPGWFEIILIRPDSPAATCGAELEYSLEDYPVLDEMHASELEWETIKELIPYYLDAPISDSAPDDWLSIMWHDINYVQLVDDGSGLHFSEDPSEWLRSRGWLEED